MPTLNGRCPWTSRNVNSHGRTNCLNVDSFETPAFTSLIISYFFFEWQTVPLGFSRHFLTHNFTCSKHSRGRQYCHSARRTRHCPLSNITARLFPSATAPPSLPSGPSFENSADRAAPWSSIIWTLECICIYSRVTPSYVVTDLNRCLGWFTYRSRKSSLISLKLTVERWISGNERGLSNAFEIPV